MGAPGKEMKYLLRISQSHIYCIILMTRHQLMGNGNCYVKNCSMLINAYCYSGAVSRHVENDRFPHVVSLKTETPTAKIRWGMLKLKNYQLHMYFIDYITYIIIWWVFYKNANLFDCAYRSFSKIRSVGFCSGTSSQSINQINQNTILKSLLLFCTHFLLQNIPQHIV